MNTPVAALRSVPTPTPTPLTQVATIRANLSARFLEREQEIRGLLVAALAGEHCLLLGPPGTGKSALARAFADCLGGANYFEWLLTRFSTPEEVYGPISLAGLKSDRFRRVTTGKLPECHIAFLDEIFKANSAVLNSLLAAVNERIFHDDGAARSIPLLTCVAASNEMPDGPELAALWDRFVLRYSVEYTKAESSFAAMLTGSGPAPAVGVMSLSEWASARAEVEAIPVPPDVLSALFSLRSSLDREGVVVSDRRWVKALKLLRANAWLSGATAVSPYHMEVLCGCLWNTAEQIQTVRAEVMKLAAAEVLVAEKAGSAAIALVATLPDGKSREFLDRASSVREELKKALARVGEIRSRLTDPGAQARVAQVEGEIRAEGQALTARIKTAVGLDF